MRTLHELLGADPRLVREALAVADRTGRSRLDVHHGGQVLEEMSADVRTGTSSRCAT